MMQQVNAALVEADLIRTTAIGLLNEEHWTTKPAGFVTLADSGFKLLRSAFTVVYYDPKIEKHAELDFVVIGTAWSRLLGRGSSGVGQGATIGHAVRAWKLDALAELLGLSFVTWSELGLKEPGAQTFTPAPDPPKVINGEGSAHEGPPPSSAPAPPPGPGPDAPQTNKHGEPVGGQRDTKRREMKHWILTIVGGEISAAKQWLADLTKDPSGNFRSLNSVDEMTEKQVFRFHRIVADEFEKWQTGDRKPEPRRDDEDNRHLIDGDHPDEMLAEAAKTIDNLFGKDDAGSNVGGPGDLPF